MLTRFVTGCSLLAALLFILTTSPSYGQTADTAVLGTVVDASGAVVPGAKIEITQPATGLTRTVESNTRGDYEVRYLVPGTYEVSVAAEGFAGQRRTSIDLQVGQQARVDFNLTVGAVSESVSVS